MRHASVRFRGEDHDVIVDSDDGFDYEVNAHVIEWHFADLSPEDHDALEIGDDEEQAIYEQLVQQSEER